ncbi:MAG: DMT family transporter [Pseudomonadota bacterium]
MDIRSIGIGLLFAFIWASAFSSARIIVADAAPMAALAFRFLVSGLIGVAIALWLGESWRLTRGQWRATIVFGICQNAIYLGLNFVAMQTVEASLASIIASTMPLMVAAAGWAILGDRLPWFGLIGLLIGFAGVAVIMSARLSIGFDVYGVTLCVIAAAALAVATLSMRGASSGGNLMMVVGLQMLVGAVVLAIASALTETVYVNLSVPWVLAFVYTTLAPGLLATWLWFTLVQRIGAVRAATFHFLTPFFGVAIAALVLGEALGPRDVVGVGIIMAGILAVQLSKQKTVSKA